MPRYYRRGYRRSWGYRTLSKKKQLTIAFAGIDWDIEKIFLELDQPSLELLFERYGREYGARAEKYARKTYPNWQSGATQLSGNTSERLLNLVPPFLSKEDRFQLIKKLRQHHFHRGREYVKTNPATWRTEVEPIVDKLVKKSADFELPSTMKNKVAWLTSGDVGAANKIMASLEQEEANIKTRYLDIEFARLDELISRTDNTESIRHTISIPQGDIHINIEIERQTLTQKIFGGSKVSTESKDIVKRDELERLLALQQDRGSLLNLTLEELSEEQRVQLKQKAMEARLDLDISQLQANHRFVNSTRDMGETIDKVDQLESSSNSDYEVRSSFDTASGKTNIHIKKNNNAVIIVVAVVIGIVIIAMMN